MRICHVTTVHKAQDARIYYRMCAGLAAKGHEVTLIAASDSPGDAEIRASKLNPRIAAAGRVRRIFLALRAAMSEGAEIYHFHDPELIVFGLALKLLRPSATVVYDVHEDYPSMMREKYWIRKELRPLVASGAKFANDVASACLDGIVTADPGVQSDFAKAGRDRTWVYYNFPVPKVFTNSSRVEPDSDLVYIGGMSERTGVFVLLDALNILSQKGLHPSVKLAGYTDGDEGRRKIEAAIQAKGLESQIVLRGRMPHTDVPDWIRSGRIGLVMLQPIAKFMKNIPTKMFEYWACGRPVIASDLPPSRPFVKDRVNGLLFDATDASSLAAAIEYAVKNPRESAEMGRLAEHQVRTSWNNDAQIGGLVEFYKSLVRKRSVLCSPSQTRV